MGGGGVHAQLPVPVRGLGTRSPKGDSVKIVPLNEVPRICAVIQEIGLKL